MLVAAVQWMGCDKAPEPARAPAPRGLPPIAADELTRPSELARAEHPPTDPTNPHGGALPPGHAHGDAPMGADPHGSMEALSPGEIEFDKKTVIAGQLQIDAKLKEKVHTGDVIYLVVRGSTADATPGPVLAVKRMEAGAFPMPFQLDSRDAMVVGTQLKPPVVVSARVDKDGDAMTKNPGDVTATTTVKALPAEKIKLNLDTVL